MAPIATGIQRVARGLLERWPVRHVEPIPFFLGADGRVNLVDVDMAVDAAAAAFDADDGVTTAKRLLRDGVTARLPIDALDVLADGYLLAEPTGRHDVLELAERWARRAPSRCFALLHDVLPLTHPELFVGRTAEMSRYFRWVARLPNVLSNSVATEQELVRLARGLRGHNWTVARPGGDALSVGSGRTSFTPSFVALGTVEPRKGIDAVLDAFERLWRRGHSYQLRVIGRRGWADEELCDRLARMDDDRECPVRWLQDATDGELARHLAASWGVIYVSEREGLGLPPLEALAVGRPVIVSSSLPAVEGLAVKPAIQRLGAVTPASIEAAVDRLVIERPEVDPDLDLPTWEQFGDAVRRWLIDGFSKDSESISGQLPG